MDYFLFDFSGVQFHYTMNRIVVVHIATGAAGISLHCTSAVTAEEFTGQQIISFCRVCAAFTFFVQKHLLLRCQKGFF